MNRPNTRKQKDNFDYLIKMLLIGDSAVGKTNIMLRFCDSAYKPIHMVTVGVDFKMKTIKIWDTAGQEKYQTMAQSYYNGAAAVIVVYSITDRNSFNNVRNWIKQIVEHVPDPIVITLVGNKCDESENQRKVDKAEGQQLADEYSIPFFEASAKENINVTELFESTAKSINDKILKNNIPNTDSAQKMRLDTYPQIIGSPSPNEAFRLSRHSDHLYAETSPFDSKSTNQQSNGLSNCQC